MNRIIDTWWRCPTCGCVITDLERQLIRINVCRVCTRQLDAYIPVFRTVKDPTEARREADQ